MLRRRELLKMGMQSLALSGLGALTLGQSNTALALDQAQSVAYNERPLMGFTQASVLSIARELAKTSYHPPQQEPLPSAFSNLTYDQYVGVKFQPSQRIWGEDNLGFVIEPLHRGYLFTAPMRLNVIENGIVQPIHYRAEDYDFGGVNVSKPLPDIGFSGFRLLKITANNAPVEVAVFQGANFFRAVGLGQNLGVTSRGLSIHTADAKGEEFPIFREVWIEKPTSVSPKIVLHAILDSTSVVGAYRFTIQPGDVTVIDVECTLLPRVSLDNIGFAPMQGTFVRGPLMPSRLDDLRPIVGDSLGLRMYNGRREWLWRPLANRETLQISSFIDDNPLGFGFLQSDREFEHFQDDDQHWENKASLWIEPIGDWKKGSVTLVEIPSESEVNQNIVTYWRPADVLEAGSETSIAYRQYWCANPPNRPDVAIVTDSRSGRVPLGNAAANGNARRRRFLVEFSSNMFETMAASDITPQLDVTAGNIVMLRSFISPQRKTFRVLFDFDPGSDTLSEMRLILMQGAKPLSETWLYRWTT